MGASLFARPREGLVALLLVVLEAALADDGGGFSCSREGFKVRLGRSLKFEAWVPMFAAEES